MDDIIANIADIPNVISKDECIYCFENCLNHLNTQNTHQHTLNVCLKCFQTVCPRHVTLHRQAAFVCQDSQHDSYLHMWKQEKAKPEGQEEQANKKLKLEVVELNEADTFDTLWEVIKYNAMSDNEDELGQYEVLSSLANSESTPTFINKILNARSRAAMDQTHSWELTLNTCDHIKNFQPELEEQIKLNLSEGVKCKDCDLTNNLWLCLHCGNVGCGREQVGIEGHTHALAHYDSHKTHSLAVKLGSLSPTTNDVYCYSCDDEVRFTDNNKLSQLLLTLFDINLAQIGTAQEKTLTELQVEQNMQWDFRMTDSQGKEFVLLPNGEKYGLGLQNLGNSCYMNSILQVLFHDSQWVDTMVDSCGGFEFPRDVMFPATNLRCQWIKLYRAVKLEPELYPHGIKPTSFKRCITHGNEEFSSQRQQDAMEFFTYLMDRVDAVGDVTQFMLMDKLTCNQCGGVKYTEQVGNSIQVSLPEEIHEGVNITNQIKQYFQPNNDDIKFDCTQCHTSVNATKELSMDTAPDLLVVNVMRMQIDKTNWSVVKTSDPLEYDDKITLNSFITNHTSGEVILPEDRDDVSNNEFIPHADVLTQLVEMGFSKEACTKAMYHTGNPIQGDVAVQWLFEHIEDPDINEPLIIESKKENNGNEYESKAQEMTQMGLSYSVCLKALKLNKGDVNASVEWVFAHPDDDGVMEEEEEEEEETKSSDKKVYGHKEIKGIEYELLDVVCHKGNSIQSGHYVEFHRNEVNEPWILYNDEKMVEVDSIEEIKCNGYIYVYRRV